MYKPGNVSECAETLVDVVALRVLNDRIGDQLSIAEDGLVVVIRGQVAVHHLRVVSYANLSKR